MRKSCFILFAVFALLSATAQAQPAGYAESVYAEYSAGTDGKVLFEVETLTTGPLSELADKTFGDLVQPAAHRIDAAQFGTQIQDARYTVPLKSSYGAHDLALTVKGFEEHGYPLDMGQYRLLQVGTAIGDDIRYHQAFEACWDELGHCAIVDPTVVFLESVVNTRLRLRAEGWGPRVKYDNDGRAFQTKATCGLASNPSQTNRVNYWGGWYIWYDNVYGVTLVEKWLGSQQSGIRCSTSCSPDPYGYSNASSCSATGGYTCDCDAKFGVGTTGSTGKWIAETKCTHRLVLAAKASASVTGYGSASVDINWDLSGGVDSNGGQIVDTCGYY